MTIELTRPKLRGLGVPFDGRPVILCIGDSFTYGGGVSPDESWPAQMQDKYLTKYQVINGGISGANLKTMHDALVHYSDRGKIEYVLLTILDIDMLRIGGRLRNENFFFEKENYQEVFNQSIRYLKMVLDICKELGTKISVNIWPRDIFITKFYRLSHVIKEVCDQRNISCRNNIQDYLSTLSYPTFIVSKSNAHPGKTACKLVALRMFEIFSKDHKI